MSLTDTLRGSKTLRVGTSLATLGGGLFLGYQVLIKDIDRGNIGGSAAYAEGKSLDKKIKQHYDLGEKYGSTKQYDDAIKEFKKVIELNPKHEDAHLWVGWICLERKEWENAINYYKKGKEINPTAKNYKLLAHAYVKGELYDKAIQECNEGLQKNPDKKIAAELYNTRGAAYYYKGDKNKAETDFLAAIKNDPENIKIKENLRKLRSVM
jgi:tetratricopeptide (TPR) repeat protein